MSDTAAGAPGSASRRVAPGAAAATAAVFPGASEMAARCRAFDWAATPLGPVDAWPVSLRTTVALLLTARHPMLLFWGPDYVQLYNDAYIPVLGGADRHPGALGQPAAAWWAGDVWAFVGPALDRVVATGEAEGADDQAVPLPRHGRVEETFWTYRYSPAYDDAGRVGGVLLITQETTARVLAERRQQALVAELAAERARLRGVILQAPVPMALHEGPEHRYALVNDAYRRVSGGGGDGSGRDVTGLTLRAAFPEVAGQGLYEVFDRVYATGAGWAGPETHLRYDRRGLGVEDAWFDLRYEPVRDGEGRVTGVLNFSVDVTDQVRARREVERLLAASEAARAEVAAANAELAAANASLADANAQLQGQQAELEIANQQLQENAAELEAQAEELQATAARLEEQAEAAARARADADAERARAVGVLESTADAYFALDADFRVTAVNGAMERGSGLARDQLLGRVVWELFPVAVGTALERHYRAAVERGREAHFRHDYSDGRLDLVVDVDAYPTAPPAGGVAGGGAARGGVAVFWRDVTARVRAEAALAASEAKYRALFDTMAQGFAVIEVLLDAAGRPADYRFLEANPAFAAQTGLANAAGRTARELVPELEQHWVDAYGGVALTGVPLRVAQPVAAIGRWFDVEAFRVGRPEDRRVAILFTDVSAARAAAAERERLLAESEAARADAERERARAMEANAGKSQFLANMSHELRTPLNAIGGYTQLLELGIHGAVSDAQREALGRVQAAQRRLLALINDVLNYAKLEGGRVEYDLGVVDVRDVVADVAPLVEPQLAAKGLAFAVRTPDGPDAAAACLVWADRAKLGQVLVNLLSNAAKFTDAGRVTVDVATRPGAAVAGGPAVFLRVADTGRGIPREKQAAVFEPFVQVQTGYARTQEGTGLGLAISRDLARGMGGDLRVRSAPGEGSVFTVVLRRAASPDGSPLDRRSHEERRAEADRRDGEDRRRDAGGEDDPSTPGPDVPAPPPDASA